MRALRIHEQHDAPEEARDFVADRLREWNHRVMPRLEAEPLCLFLRDASGAIQGGLLGETRWHRLLVDILWIADAMRGKGYGSALLKRAESVAWDRGCRRATLNTAEFQARGFYEKHGYEVFATQEDMPPGSRQYFMSKTLRWSRD